MIYENSANCANCPLREKRNEMVEHWQSFEDSVNTANNTQLVEEGYFRCIGPKKWAVGPLVLGYTCQAEPSREPKAEMIGTDQQFSL